jgi:hypothetical protein
VIKVLANRVVNFEDGEVDRHGQKVRVSTAIGFCELPDWVEKTPYYKMAIKDGVLQTFTASSESEQVQKLNEQAEALKKEIRMLEEQKALAKKPSDVKQPTLNPPIYYKDGDNPPVKTESVPVVFNDTRQGSDNLEASVEVDTVPTTVPKRTKAAKS